VPALFFLDALKRQTCFESREQDKLPNRRGEERGKGQYLQWEHLHAYMCVIEVGGMKWVLCCASVLVLSTPTGRDGASREVEVVWWSRRGGLFTINK
jgi:hypothetical protein